ncbi:hypothetical protein, partial [Pseudomonas sp. MWU12-2323]|uniref:hypothetical protein n=1 Tax=Pseudomonas sp. MWU12-2323 TaxID=2651296 RepID=UPI001C49863A
MGRHPARSVSAPPQIRSSRIVADFNGKSLNFTNTTPTCRGTHDVARIINKQASIKFHIADLSMSGA